MNQPLPSAAVVAALIDHAILKPEFTRADVDAQLDEAAEYGVFSVCVRPSDVAHAAQRLAGTGVAVGTVIGFPHGTTSTAAKVAESRQALADGAVELDMVQHIGALRGGQTELVADDIRAVVGAADGHIVKVILETVFLSPEQIALGSRIAANAGADFVKTSTGFSGGGANADDLRIMRASVPERVQVKASGGVRELDTLLAFRELGVTRFGTSGSKAILDELAHRLATGERAGLRADASY